MGEINQSLKGLHDKSGSGQLGPATRSSTHAVDEHGSFQKHSHNGQSLQNSLTHLHPVPLSVFRPLAPCFLSIELCLATSNY